MLDAGKSTAELLNQRCWFISTDLMMDFFPYIRGHAWASLYSGMCLSFDSVYKCCMYINLNCENASISWKLVS